MNCGIADCSFYGHNIEHNRQLFEHCSALLKSIIGENLSIIGRGLPILIIGYSEMIQ